MKVLLTRDIKDEKGLFLSGSVVDFDTKKAKGLIKIGVANAMEEIKKEVKPLKQIKKVDKE